MKEKPTSDMCYKEWIEELHKRYRSSQIKAASSVNKEMLLFYWSLGRDIVQMDAENIYGSGFYEKLSSDLSNSIPDSKGFSPRNIRYMKRLFIFNAKIYEILTQVGAKLPWTKTEPVAKLPQVVAELPQAMTEPLEELFSIPWGHIRLLIDNCKNDPQKALFYIRKTIENNWSRATLQNWVETDLYERRGKAINNFAETLPSPQGDLAQEITKDPYTFDFLTISPKYNEKELKDALTDNIQRFLMELGSGFSFVGREYRLLVGNTEQLIDLLFYNYRIHCFVVVEVKVTEFSPRDMGQLITYVSEVDGLLKAENDQPTVGLLLCKTKDNVLAHYATNAVKVPVSISEYQISHVLNEDYRNTLPSIETLERELSRR